MKPVFQQGSVVSAQWMRVWLTHRNDSIDSRSEHQHMKCTFSTNSQPLAMVLAAILLASAPLVPVANAAGEEPIRTAGSISYVSGGVGMQSIERLNVLASQFNLKLVFALKTGDYLSGVGVAITDSTGRTLLNTTSNGPWFLTQLPAGDYRVAASFSGNVQTQQVAVAAATLTTADFRWASE
jgi:hypothetical protein